MRPRHHDLHLYAEYSGTRQNNVDGGVKTASQVAALALGFRYGYQTPHHTLFGASVRLGLTHDSPNYGRIIQSHPQLSHLVAFVDIVVLGYG